MERTILIVDDNPDDIEITRIVMAETGRQEKVSAARSGEAALHYLRSADDLPVLIMLDLKTPGMSGIDTLRQIRLDERLKHIPVIMVTASSYGSDEQEAYAAGADGFLLKAFDLDEFSRKLNSLLERILKQ